MSVQFTFPTSATLAGARNVNRVHRAMAQDDVGFKVERLISMVNAMQSSVSTLNVAVSYINTSIQQAIVCAASFASALSTANLASTTATSTVLLTLSALSNFRA